MIITPNDFLKFLHEISQQIVRVPKERLDKNRIPIILKDLFSDDNIKLLNTWKDLKSNRTIVKEALSICKLISSNDFKLLKPYLLRIDTDEETRRLIINFADRKVMSIFFYRLVLFLAAAVFLIFLILPKDKNYLDSNSSSLTSNRDSDDIPMQNGDLNSEFGGGDVEVDSVMDLSIDNSDQKSALDKIENKQSEWKKSGWVEQSISNGSMPECYNFTPRYSKISNYLDVKVGSGTDVVVKLIEKNTDHCVRYVFINRSSSYVIRNIPEGLYYLKIAYGKNWYSKVENHLCHGKFLLNAFYEVGSENLDFNLNYYEDGSGYDIPSYKLSLDVQNSGVQNSFSSEEISEAEFND
jgi:hypothetical protein